MTPAEHIQKLRDACEGLSDHAERHPAIFTVINDIECDIHELEQAFTDIEFMET
jgi:hypothetical protein